MLRLLAEENRAEDLGSRRVVTRNRAAGIESGDSWRCEVRDFLGILAIAVLIVLALSLHEVAVRVTALEKQPAVKIDTSSCSQWVPDSGWCSQWTIRYPREQQPNPKPTERAKP